MDTKALIARINALSRKDRKQGLSDDERAEQKKLRRAYLDSIRDQVRGMLDAIEFVDDTETVTHVSQVEITLGQKPMLH